MNDELDPKLQEFEAKLRRLKPYSVPPPSRPPRDWKRMIVYALATTATALIVWLATSPQEPGAFSEPGASPPGDVALSRGSALRGLTPPARSMREQLKQLLDEMDVADPVAEKKPKYPVIEIAVSDAPPKENISPPFERLRLRFDEHELSMF